MDYSKRRELIIREAYRQATKRGYTEVTAGHIAEAAGCSRGLVQLHLPNALAIRGAIMAYAVHHGGLSVIAQGLAFRHPLALAAPVELREQAAKLLAEPI
jgi:AcrR family transcriptional regulator